MLYSDDELEGRDIATHYELSQVDKVPLPFQKNWETSESKDRRILDMDVGSTLEVKAYLEEGCSSRDEFDGEYLKIDDNF